MPPWCARHARGHADWELCGGVVPENVDGVVQVRLAAAGAAAGAGYGVGGSGGTDDGRRPGAAGRGVLLGRGRRRVHQCVDVGGGRVVRRGLGRGVRPRGARRPVARPFRARSPLEVPGGLVAVLKVARILRLSSCKHRNVTS